MYIHLDIHMCELVGMQSTSMSDGWVERTEIEVGVARIYVLEWLLFGVYFESG